MKRYIKASSSRQLIFASDDGMFELYDTSGVYRNGKSWRGLDMESNGLADKYHVHVYFDPSYNTKESDSETIYRHAGVVISITSLQVLTLEQTEEYIPVLKSAIQFGQQVDDYLRTTEYYVAK